MDVFALKFLCPIQQRNLLVGFESAIKTQGDELPGTTAQPLLKHRYKQPLIKETHRNPTAEW